MNMYINGHWKDPQRKSPVTSPYTGEVIDTVSAVTPEHVEEVCQRRWKAQQRWQG